LCVPSLLCGCRSCEFNACMARQHARRAFRADPDHSSGHGRL
jgi:hypothetical protein